MCIVIRLDQTTNTLELCQIEKTSSNGFGKHISFFSDSFYAPLCHESKESKTRTDYVFIPFDCSVFKVSLAITAAHRKRWRSWSSPIVTATADTDGFLSTDIYDQDEGFLSFLLLDAICSSAGVFLRLSGS